MDFEKSIILIHPVSNEVKELAAELEQDNSYTLYEVDSQNEYSQILGMAEHSVTFSSDVKKLAQSLNANKQKAKSKEAKSILISQKELSALEYGKLQKIGLDEQLQSTNQKTLKTKVEMFFAPFVKAHEKKLAELEREKKEKERAKKKKNNEQLTSKLGGSVDGASEKRKIGSMIKESDGNTRQSKIQDFGFGNLMGMNFSKQTDKTKKSRAFVNNKNLAEFKLEKMIDLSSQTESTDNKIGQMILEEDEGLPSLKRPQGQEQTETTVSNMVLEEKGEEKERPKSGGFKEGDLGGVLQGKKGIQFQAVDPKQNRTKAHNLLLGELKKKKRPIFEEVEAIKEKKKNHFGEGDLGGHLSKKETGFKEAEAAELEKKRARFEEVERELNKKRKIFEEIERDLNKKRVRFVEVEREKEEKEKLDNEDPKNSNKRKVFEEVERELKKKKYDFEEVMRELERKKRQLGETTSLEKKRKVFEEVEHEYEREKVHFEEVLADFNNKIKNLDEIEKEASKKKQFEEVDRENEKKHGQLNENLDGHMGAKTDGETLDKHLKGSSGQSFEEVKREKSDLEVVQQEKVQKEEQVLDYTQFKKQYRQMAGQKSTEQEVRNQKKREDLQAKSEEVRFYNNTFFELEDHFHFARLINNFERNIDKEMKFVDFIIQKKLGGLLFVSNLELTQYKSKKDLPAIFAHLLSIEEENLFSHLRKITSPVWKDETFQTDQNYFILPVGVNQQMKGHLCALFENGVTPENAKKLESYLILIKGGVI